MPFNMCLQKEAAAEEKPAMLLSFRQAPGSINIITNQPGECRLRLATQPGVILQSAFIKQKFKLQHIFFSAPGDQKTDNKVSRLDATSDSNLFVS